MIAAFACWNERIAPVFDVARKIRIVEVESGRIIRETEETLIDRAPAQRALHLTALGVETLVCGAITRSMLGMIVALGIRVIPFVSGDVRHVVDAWRRGALGRGHFAMPGRGGRRRFSGIDDPD